MTFLLFVGGAISAINPATIIPNTCDGIQPRLEIRDLSRNEDQYTLLLLALKRMQEANSSDPMSYYAIAGIHGFPYKDYDDFERCEKCNSIQGYCPHISNLFAIWHRPYLALFERSLRENAILVANQYSQGPIRKRFLAAAHTLRLPYWDFAKPAEHGEEAFPSLFTHKYTQVSGPYGRVQIENPLYSYKFHGDPAPGEQGLSQHETTRHPMKNDTRTSRQDSVFAAVRDLQSSQGHDLRCSLYRLMYQNESIDDFSGSALFKGELVIPYENIESIHDDVHVAIGGAGKDETTWGTMYYISSSSFDPIFWLHHAMVDRMLAMWQVLHPDSWMDTRTGTSTRTIPVDMAVDGTTPLAPFFMDINGTSWTGDTSRSIGSFCYSYAEFDAFATVEEVSIIIKSFYSQDCLVGPPPSGVSAVAAPKFSSVNAILNARGGTSPRTRSLHLLGQSISGLITVEGTMRDYIANIQLDSMMLGETATVYIFDGSVSEDTKTWDQSPHYIGKKMFLVKGGSQNMSGQVKKGSVSMNNAIMTRVTSKRLLGMEPDEVLAYLRANMQWRVVNARGIIIPNTAVPGLVVSVVTADIVPASDEGQLPVWVNARLLREITAGKAGGFVDLNV